MLLLGRFFSLCLHRIHIQLCCRELLLLASCLFFLEILMNVVARGGSLHLRQRLSGVATNAPLGILATFCFARSSAPALPPKANVERFVLWHNGQPKRATHSAYNLTAPRCPDAVKMPAPFASSTPVSQKAPSKYGGKLWQACYKLHIEERRRSPRAVGKLDILTCCSYFVMAPLFWYSSGQAATPKARMP